MRREDLDRARASEFLEALLQEDSTDAQIAAALVALSAKGETVAELAGMAEAMRARAVRLRSTHERFIDTAGTGSSRAKTFNVSTAVAFVVAAAGLPVAKHGNRAASSNCGSADVLGALGVNVSAATEVSERCLNEIGICFMFAPLYHGATARVAAVRRQLGVPTTFNLIGPLTNPAGAPYQIVGVSRREKAELIAQALAMLGSRQAWVVHGEDGLDEITLAGRTFVTAVQHGEVNSFEVGPEDFGYEIASLAQLNCQDVESSALMIRSVLSGDRRDEARGLVVINAAAALLVGGSAIDLRYAANLAAETIDSGSALAKLEALVRMTS
ncbi:MAG: anthranilate phosphoribosyltransferase [Blastocatellia bacterium]|nr:anthranilate phosphoribosyltransferase [Blastocatellia bacterium]